MAHFAKIDSNNIVQQVVAISNDVLVNFEGNEIEQLGIEFCKSLYGQDTNWVQTSYNGNIRFRYAGIGMTYDSVNNVFLHPKPFNSWLLNETTWEWEAPSPQPDGAYVWNETMQTWDAVNIDS